MSSKVENICLVIVLTINLLFHEVNFDQVTLWYGEAHYHIEMERGVVAEIHRKTTAGESTGSILASYVNDYRNMGNQGMEILCSTLALICYDHTPSIREQKLIWSAVQLLAFIH